jgi:hypothetical protein
MHSNNRLLSILHIIYGGLTLLIALFFFTIVESLLPFIMNEVPSEGAFFIDFGLQIVRTLAIFYAIAVPIPSIIGGVALLNGKKWGLTWMLISGCISLFSFPFGTALGVFSIIVFSQNQKEVEA